MHLFLSVREYICYSVCVNGWTDKEGSKREREIEGLSRYTLGVFSMTLPGAIIQCDMTTHAHTEWVLEGGG